MLSTKKKVLIFVLIIIVIVVIATMIRHKDPGTAGGGPDDQLTAGQSETEMERTPKEAPSESGSEKEKALSWICGRTYIFYDEFLAGKPVTYTFYDNGTMVAYYWEDTESESIPLSSEWAKYAVNDDLTEITLEWDDGTGSTEEFEIKGKGSGIRIGEAEFDLSDREIHLN